jgi:hypothetical protein
MGRIAWGSFAVGAVAAVLVMWFLRSRSKTSA